MATYTPQNNAGSLSQGNPWGDFDFNTMMSPTQVSQAYMPTNLQTALNPDGSLASQYQLQAQPIAGYQGNQALGAIQQQATQPSQNSAWNQLMQQQIASNTKQQVNNATAQGGANQAAARSQLAQFGGLSSGARVALANQGEKNTMAARQGAQMAGEQQSVGAATQAEQNRLNALGQYGQLGQAQSQGQNAYNLAQQQYQTGVQQSNIQNALGSMNAQNQLGLGIYQQQMAAYGAGQTANAEASHKK